MKLAATLSIRRYWAAFRRDSLLRNSAYFFSNTLSVSALGFGFWWLAARLYAAELVGGAVVIIATAQMVTTLSNFGLSFALIRFLPNSQDQRAMINFALTFVAGVTAVLAAGVILPGARLFDAFAMFRLEAGFSALVFVFVVSLALFQLSSPIFAALKAAGLLLWVNFFTAAGRLILVLILSIRPHTLTLILSFALPTLLAIFIVYLFVLPKRIAGYHPRVNLRLAEFKPMIRYALPSYSGNILHDAPYQLLPTIVAYQVGMASAAYFYIVWNIFSLITAVGSSISLSLFVEGSHDSLNLPRLARKTLTSSVGLTAIIAIAVIVLAQPILLLFGADYAASGVALLRIVSMSAVPAAIIYSRVAALRVEMRLKKIVTAFALIALISLPLAISPLGEDLVAMGYIWLFAQTIAAAYVVVTP